MDKVELEIVIISAHDLKDVSKLGRAMRTFAVVWSDSTTQNSTRVDREGGSNPTWNHKFQTSVTNYSLHQKGSNFLIHIFCKTLLGEKPIGCARVPYSDILDGHGSPHSLHLLSYRITRPNGKRRGTIHLSVRFLDKINGGVGISKPELNLPGFPIKPRVRRNDANMEGNGQCAIGIPVSSLQPFHFAQQQNISWMPSSHYGPQNISSY